MSTQARFSNEPGLTVKDSLFNCCLTLGKCKHNYYKNLLKDRTTVFYYYYWVDQLLFSNITNAFCVLRECCICALKSVTWFYILWFNVIAYSYVWLKWIVENKI